MSICGIGDSPCNAIVAIQLSRSACFSRYYENAQINCETREAPAQRSCGHGASIPEKYHKHLADIADGIRVLHKWQQGDVLVFDSTIAQYGRQRWKVEQSDRMILASLFDGESVPGTYADHTLAARSGAS